MNLVLTVLYTNIDSNRFQWSHDCRLRRKLICEKMYLICSNQLFSPPGLRNLAFHCPLSVDIANNYISASHNTNISLRSVFILCLEAKTFKKSTAPVYEIHTHWNLSRLSLFSLLDAKYYFPEKNRLQRLSCFPWAFGPNRILLNSHYTFPEFSQWSDDPI